VLIHDSARPFVGPRHVRPLVDAVAEADGACPALPVADTLKRAVGGQVQATVDRAGLWRVQTPQAFRYATIEAAYAGLPPGGEATDDAGVVEAAGGRVALTPGDPRLEKLTRAEDFIVAEAFGGRRSDHGCGPGLRRARVWAGNLGLAVRPGGSPRPRPCWSFGR
jgi:2-C-methyl-D-erythritol 4-phosphate cytidylyltransferase/2-C-methyl-D-erythritol 2,4-cyclodiphosphate synthase